MAAVVYLKVTDATGSSNISLVCELKQVAPLKPTTIPRMELNAAVLRCIFNGDTKLNPADCASRGLTAAKLEQHSLWWTGPKWLSQSKENWPSVDIPSQTVSHLEERPGLVFTIYKADSHPLYTLLDKFSKLSPLLHTLGICLRAIAKFKKVPQSTLATPLATVDLELAKTLLIKYTQSQYHSQELKLLKNGDSLQRNHRLAKLIPYVDYNEVLRVGGRLKNSLLDDERNNPVILPRTSHRGTQLTIADLRRSDWIEGGQVPARSHILRCVRYIYIEIIMNYSTDAFAAAFRRFTNRRGACNTLYSDCGTNFIGADATLRKEFAAGSRQLKELQYLLATDGTDCKFNPSSAPHFGDKWEAAVKSIKFHFIRTIGESLLTYDQLATVNTD
ncbi:uncharacterized protein LOC130668607 [Microplitis mediator]|uniref:uncharacterized protein LOC130668607 n=1 Tax=Microplitis mediator TaxID=375433 RepID=UPI0025527106|nr:uncharacterized protein LOC130668607 [Microplitis mediator]